jgi:ABC-2 type transport system permease protein
MKNFSKKIANKYRYSAILLKELVITEFKLRYQNSVLGYVWSLLRPLLLFVILYLVFVFFLKVGDDVPHWPVAMLLGIVLWNFFTEVTNQGVSSIVNRSDVIRKINFPKYVIVLSTSISALINLAINMVVILVFMVISKVDFSPYILLAPLFILELFVFALGIAFLLGALFVRFRDVNYIWEIIMQALFYASIVIYPVKLVIDKTSPQVAEFLMLNPVAQIIQDLRHVMVSRELPTLLSVSGNLFVASLPILFVIATFILGSAYFKKRSKYFAEEV